MNKVKVTADAVMTIINGILTEKSVDIVLSDPSVPPEWKGKTVTEALNVEYFSFKHRPASSEEIIAEKFREQSTSNMLTGLSRSFCLVSLQETERIYSKDVDMAVVSATMEYWVQTDKIQLLEFLIEECNIGLSGIRIPVKFGSEERQAVVIFSPVDVIDINSETMCGEMANCVVHVNLLLYPDVISYCDYEVSFEFIGDIKIKDENGQVVEIVQGKINSGPVPLSSFSFVNSMTQKAVPFVKNIRKVGNINLSCASSFVLVFDGYKNSFINHITEKALTQNASELDNNESYIMTVIRNKKPFIHEVVIKDHQVLVNADTGNETHTLSLVTRGI